LRGIVAIAYVATIARLLSPADFGLVAVPAAIFFMIAPLAAFGLGSSVLYLFDLTKETLNSIFWTTVALSSGVGLLLVLSAPLVARFYERSEMLPVTMVFGLVALLAGVGAIPSHLMLRQMRYGRHALIELGALLVSVIGAIGAALLGWGHWSLVVSHLALQAASVSLFFINCGWRPGRPQIGRNVLPAMRYGSHLTAFHLIAALKERADHLLIGRLLGTVPLGTYSTTSDLIGRITNRLRSPFHGIAVSTLSKLQREPEEYRHHFRATILWSTSVALPVVALAALDPDLMVGGLLGPQWTEAVPIFRVLAISAAAKLTRPATGWVFQSLGQTDRQLRWGIGETVVFVTAFVIGIRWGILGVATAGAIAAIALIIPRVLYCYRMAPLDTGDLLAAMWRPWVAAGAAALIWTLIGPLPPLFARNILQLAASLVVFGAIYAAIWVALPGGWALVLEAARASIRPGRETPRDD
jgi:PST family polysaccharide transporter